MFRSVYLRPCYRARDGKRHAYWALVQSVRTAKGPRQKVVAYLGDLDEAGRLGVQRAAEGEDGSTQQGEMFDPPQARYVEVDLSGVVVERVRQFGGPWLALQLIGKLRLKSELDRLMPAGREDVSWSIMSLVLVICRLCDPSSELRIAGHLCERSAMPDLLGVGADKINDDRLYRALDKLLPHKAELEERYGTADRIWMMDRGMVSAANVEFPRGKANAGTSWGRTRLYCDAMKSN